MASVLTDPSLALHPAKEGTHTPVSYLRQARETNAGWRIDYFITSECLQGSLKDATIHNEIFGSDHCPVGLELAL